MSSFSNQLSVFGQRRQWASNSSPGGWSNLFSPSTQVWVDSVGYAPYYLNNWRERIRNRQSATTGMNAEKRTARGFNGHYVLRTIRSNNPLANPLYQYYEMRGTLTFNGAFVTLGAMPILDTVNARAYSKFLSRIYKAQQEIQSLVCFGELGQTLRMLRHPLESLRNGFSDYLRTVKSRGSKSRTRNSMTRVVSDTWLEYNFGFKPLMNDVEGLAKSAARLVHNYRPERRVRVNESETEDARLSLIAIGQSGNGNVYSYPSEYKKASVKYTASVSPPRKDVSQYATVLGLRPRDFLPSIWELIPYSFVADYFSNAGELIEACMVDNAAINWMEKGTYRSVERRIDAIGFELLPAPPGWHHYDLQTTFGDYPSFKRELKTRDRFFLQSLPNFQFEIPGLNSRKWLNLGALFASGKRTQDSLQGRFRGLR